MEPGTRETVTTLLSSIHTGDRAAASELLPLVYDELRRLARHRMAGLAPGQTLEPTALVNEAYMRLVGDDEPDWDGKGHFFAAAAQAMRNVIVDHARAKQAVKRGGDREREGLHEDVAVAPANTNELGDVDLVRLDDALNGLHAEGTTGQRRCEVVVMRYFAGLTHEQIARSLGVDKRTVDRDWRYARAWLLDALTE